ncbi:hypothetical protein [Bradyrhizobium quebecense]|uniref:Uncharacterized protein n=2 Tax=Bradyrhizobium quebecense TaxID=2748629 RepID=A0ABS3M8X1_9BRAD|nr:hypothetical protein [Bradyrhizobium quebecense]UGY03283.1 hypothetical protein J4P68_0000425 [Bradyrhizobium quebecense]
MDAFWESVRTQRELMRVMLPSGAAGPGHNKSPDFAPTAVQDMLEANRLIELLSEDGPRNKARAVEILQAAQTAEATAGRGKAAINAFALGVIQGAGKKIGENAIEALADTAWWTGFYARLSDLASAAIEWVKSIL